MRTALQCIIAALLSIAVLHNLPIIMRYIAQTGE
jgi:hypothetical protein